MSKTKKILAHRPLEQKREQKKLVNRRMRQIDSKIRYEKAKYDPYGVKDGLAERMLFGKIGYLNKEDK